MTPPLSHDWSGRVFLSPGLILYAGPGATADEHTHHAVQLVWAPHGVVTIRMAGKTVRVEAALIPANTAHAFDAGGHPIALLLVERHGARGAALDRLARSSPVRDLGPRLREQQLDRAIDRTNAAAWIRDVLEALAIPHSAAAEPSLAVRRALAFVDEHVANVPRLTDAAASLGLSPTRLTHLFSSEVGIPFRRYILWVRLKRAVEAARRGASLTDAAMEAGFSDSAHFSRTFRATFGLSPSLIVPHVEIVGSLWTS